MINLGYGKAVPWFAVNLVALSFLIYLGITYSKSEAPYFNYEKLTKYAGVVIGFLTLFNFVILGLNTGKRRLKRRILASFMISFSALLLASTVTFVVLLAGI